jgi:zeaxanthin glucosyltransferase
LRIALIPAAFPSHVAAFAALAEALARRGHAVTLLGREEMRSWPAAAVFPAFEPIAASGAPALDAVVRHAARPSFPFGVLRVVRGMAALTSHLAAELPARLRRIGAEACFCDQMEPAGALAARRLDLPFVSVAPALPIEPDPTLPLPVLGWSYDPSPRGIRRNRGGRRVADHLMRPLHATIERLSGGEWRRPEDCLSQRASLWQLVPGLDFPRAALPPGARYVGPLRALPAAASPPLDLPIRGGRPLVYASLGTLQGHRIGLFRRIASACRAIGAELVVSHCGCLPPEAAARIGADHVVADLPQRAAIAAARVVVTHGGLNTVLDTAEAGRPMLVLPIAFDQPGVAARVAFSGAGLALDHRFATSGGIARALDRLLAEPSFAAASRRIGTEIAAAPGAEGAVLLAERALAGAGAPTEIAAE